MPPKRKDVLSVFAGLAPFGRSQKKMHDTKEISSSHKILVSQSRLFSIIGGKWTTYRKMGEDMIDKIEKELQWNHTTSTSASFNRSMDIATSSNQMIHCIIMEADETFVKKIIEETENELISEKLQIWKAQVIWAVRAEMARTAEDFLSRRTRCLAVGCKRKH